MTVPQFKTNTIVNLTKKNKQSKKHKKKICEKDVIETTPHSPAGVQNGVNATADDQDIRVRKYGEVVYNTLSTVASVLEYPKGNPPGNLYE